MAIGEKALFRPNDISKRVGLDILYILLVSLFVTLEQRGRPTYSTTQKSSEMRFSRL